MKPIEKILEEIFDTGETTYEFKILDKYAITVRNITSEDYMQIEAILSNKKKTAIGYAQEFILERVARVVQKVENKTFSNVDDCKAFLLKMPASFTNKILEEHKKFEKQIKTALQVEEIEDNFFDKGALQEKPKQQQKASTSENQALSEK
jgi:hypothetical protein